MRQRATCTAIHQATGLEVLGQPCQRAPLPPTCSPRGPQTAGSPPRGSPLVWLPLAAPLLAPLQREALPGPLPLAATLRPPLQPAALPGPPPAPAGAAAQGGAARRPAWQLPRSWHTAGRRAAATAAGPGSRPAAAERQGLGRWVGGWVGGWAQQHPGRLLLHAWHSRGGLPPGTSCSPRPLLQAAAGQLPAAAPPSAARPQTSLPRCPPARPPRPRCALRPWRTLRRPAPALPRPHPAQRWLRCRRGGCRQRRACWSALLPPASAATTHPAAATRRPAQAGWRKGPAPPRAGRPQARWCPRQSLPLLKPPLHPGRSAATAARRARGPAPLRLPPQPRCWRSRAQPVRSSRLQQRQPGLPWWRGGGRGVAAPPLLAAAAAGERAAAGEQARLARPPVGCLPTETAPSNACIDRMEAHPLLQAGQPSEHATPAVLLFTHAAKVACVPQNGRRSTTMRLLASRDSQALPTARHASCCSCHGRAVASQLTAAWQRSHGFCRGARVSRNHNHAEAGGIRVLLSPCDCVGRTRG